MRRDSDLRLYVCFARIWNAFSAVTLTVDVRNSPLSDRERRLSLSSIVMSKSQSLELSSKDCSGVSFLFQRSFPRSQRLEVSLRSSDFLEVPMLFLE